MTPKKPSASEIADQLRSVTFPLGVALTNPALHGNMRHIDRLLAECQALGMSEAQVEQVTDAIGYTGQLPVRWATETYNHPRWTLELVRDALARGVNPDDIITALTK